MLALWFFDALAFVLLGFLTTAAVAALLRPVAARIPGPRAFSGTVAGTGFAGVIVGVIALLWWRLNGPIEREIANGAQIKESLNAVLARWSERLGLAPVDVDTLAERVFGFQSGEPPLSRIASVTATVLIAMTLVFFGSIYLLADRPGRLTDPLVAMLPRRAGPRCGASSPTSSRGCGGGCWGR